MQRQFVRGSAQSSLFGLTIHDINKSFESVFGKTSVIAAILYAASYIIALKEVLLSEWKKDVEDTAATTRYGTWAWWIAAAKAFQFGDTTSVIDGKVGYEVVDPSKQIITAATVAQVGRSLTVKVAKGAVGSLSELSQEELQAFNGYVQNIKPLGVSVRVSSLPPASVEIAGSITYNSEEGEAAMKSRVLAALNDYFANLSFGSTIYRSQVIERIMSIDGVIDVQLQQLRVSGYEVQTSYAPQSGYAKITNSNGLTMEANYDTGR